MCLLGSQPNGGAVGNMYNIYIWLSQRVSVRSTSDGWMATVVTANGGSASVIARRRSKRKVKIRLIKFQSFASEIFQILKNYINM